MFGRKVGDNDRHFTPLFNTEVSKPEIRKICVMRRQIRISDLLAKQRQRIGHDRQADIANFLFLKIASEADVWIENKFAVSLVIKIDAVISSRQGKQISLDRMRGERDGNEPLRGIAPNGISGTADRCHAKKEQCPT